jgi:hypothetical protein
VWGLLGKVRARLGRYRRQLLGQPLPARPVSPPTPVAGLSPLATKLAELDNSRQLGPRGFEALIAMLRTSADEVVTVREAARRGVDLPGGTAILRHDIDLDIENAVRFATLEAAHGLRSTYFVLHSAWYYRWQSGDAIAPMTLDALHRIASMGHEIGLHNDVIGVALQKRTDPTEILRSELEELRSHGFEIAGTAAHGDWAVINAGLVNYKVFAERAGTDPIDVEVDGQRMFSFTPRPLADFGLEYEAYSTPAKIYMADSGGRLNVHPQWVGSELQRGNGPVTILTHPEAWALVGMPMPTRRPPAIKSLPAAPSAPTRFERADEARPLRIIARGDCCSRRAVSMNPEMFGPVEYIKDEKSRSDFFVDHPAVGSPSRMDMMRYVSVDRINNSSHRYYQFCQTDRDTLGVRNADLIMLDSYGDMNFQAWQHRTFGWKLWAPMAFLRDTAKFYADFESVGYLSLDDSVAYHVALIEHYRRMNGHIPVLFLKQPIAYYEKLDDRAEFGELGSRLEELVPDLYYGSIPDADLEPDDMDSSGPGQTLHFTAKTYRQMIEVALEKGLAEWMPRTMLPSRD